MNKFFYLILLAIFNLLYATDSIAQKLADEPHDRSLVVDVGEKYYCYTPTFDNNEGYIFLSETTCGTKAASLARYDVFERIAFKVKSTWLCLTAPDSVTGYEGEQSQSWDYAVLRPCVINDPNQKFIIKDRAFYTYDGKYKLQDHHAYIVISKDNSYTNQMLNFRMNTWLQTVAKPVTLAIKTHLIWSLKEGDKVENYAIANGSSSKVEYTPWLYYNTEDGRIFSYVANSGTLMCLSSSQTDSQSWNWASWIPCNDLTQNPENTHWKLRAFVDNSGIVSDFNGNLLRLTRYGSHWGVAYTAALDYIETDTTHSPTSNFTLSKDVGKWLRYAYGNMGKNLTYCPAPGKVETHRKKRQLPPAFSLTEEWIQRLYAIARTAESGTSPYIGVCGVCLLHTHEIVAELLRYGYGNPPASGGHFFDVVVHTNPFASFRERFPDLSERLEGIMNYRDVPLEDDGDMWDRRRRVIYATNQALAPQNIWVASPVARSIEEMRDLYARIMHSPLGSIWTISMSFIRPSHPQPRTIGHGQPIIRTQEGLILLPTNAPSWSMEHYRQELAPITSPDEFIDRITDRGGRQIFATFAFMVSEFHQQDTYESFISVNNCDGDGENSRGSGRYPRINAINQCMPGRCAIQ
ncbi:DUF1561 family protein [Helicobacter anatolicus]|uniref:DUF1561 family protein n=1 Tax=Helicobacter anatolicus TaxID=2905874 RepID=UPI001E3FA427|nr:DUF1561 family protein [Helicobacter anatolicus]MCE3040283.1 DUF1561 domain-containing protein [Helicobacter anatolicus]